MDETTDRTSTLRLGIASAASVSLLSFVYAIVMAIGLWSLPAPDVPIADPWFTAMEILILLLIPAIVMLTAALHSVAPAAARASTQAALVFATLLCGTTGAVHFSILLLSRGPVLATLSNAPFLLSFRWPSLPYALDVLAWDIFFPLMALTLLPAFRGGGSARAIRMLMATSAGLALIGLLGIPVGNMQVRNIGIIGYAVVYPLAAAMMVLWFRRAASALGSSTSPRSVATSR